MPSCKYLAMRLKAPLQSAGLRGSFDERFTETMPTKSLAVGLLARALGVERGDRKAIGELSSMKMMAVCTKEGTVFTDYHTVGHAHTDPQKELLSADGKSLEGAVTRRQYLCGYSFVVAFEGDTGIVDRCAVALCDPVRSLFIGRKCCIPSAPIFAGVYPTKTALKSFIDGEAGKGRTMEECRVSCEVSSGGVVERDVPVDFQSRQYISRKVVQDSTAWFE